jgi:exonuclease III
LGDFNCAIQKNLDRNPPQQLDDISVREFQSMLHRNDLFDVWRKLNSETKRYTFKRGKSKSRIDYILCSNAVSSKVFGTRINHFPFSLEFSD